MVIFFPDSWTERLWMRYRPGLYCHLVGRQRKRSQPDVRIYNVQAFCLVLSEKLKDKESNFGKEYIKLLVDEIRVEGENVHLKGSYGALAGALQTTKPGHPNGVTGFGHVWLLSADSNHGPDG